MGIRSYLQQALASTVYYGSNVNRAILDFIRGDVLFNYTSLLLDGDGTNATQNNTFLDSSSNNFTITRNGNTTQGSFSPFGDKWSNYFDGTGDTLQTTAVNISTGNFTIETWVNLDSMPTTDSWPGSFSNWMEIIGVGSNNLGDGWQFRIGQTVLAFGTNSDTTAISATHGMSVGKWYHLACTRNGNVYTLYVNGSSIGSATYTDNNPGTGAFTWIGSETNQGAYLKGYISNVRVIAGTALYTTNFTPPTAPLTAISGTSLLTCQSNRFLDASTNNFTITRNGDVRVQSFNPFGLSSSYSPASDGASGYFDGNTDFLSTTGGASFDLSSGNWTIEAWVYVTAAANNMVVNLFQTTDSNGGLTFWVNSSNQLVVDNGLLAAIAAGSVPINQWVHIAASRSSGTTTAYVNGTSVGTTTQAPNTSQGARIGALVTNNYYFNGYISNLRILKGTALYTTNFTPPTEPLSAVTNTSLLLNFANAGIYDKTKNNVLETVGNAQVSTTQKKYGTGALYFDGTGDYLSTRSGPHLTFGGDFTIEAWVYITSLATYHPILEGRAANTYSNYVFGIYNVSGTLRLDFVNAGGATNRTATTTSVPLNTWTHVAWVRSGGTTSYYVNGVKDTTTNSYSASLAPASSNVLIGAVVDPYYFNGYIDELRITNGIARYLGNFTPPTREFASIFGSDPEDNTILASGGTIIDSGSYRNHIFTSPGSFTVIKGGNIGVEYLVVAGGGGGGAGALAAANGGGGGGGGFRTGTNFPITTTTYPITVGGGGAADSQGSPSVFSTITSVGGGYGGGTTANIGGSGGSGGGGRTTAGGPYAGGSGNTPPISPPQGNPGGSSNPLSPFEAGGGGGAGEAGNTDGLGFGGDGFPITWLPASYGTPGTAPGRYFSGGGGGGSDSANIVGGEGGGGSGGRGAPAISGSSGTTNTGGGGGGGASQPPAIPGLSGGSGIVVIRYPI